MRSLGIGLYTLSDAAQLTGADRRAIKRWLFGYDYTSPGEQGRIHRHSAPLWNSQHRDVDLGQPVVGFHDLLELRVVSRFAKCGVPLLVIRRCLDTARELFGAEYPLIEHRFVTDGETIFHQALRETGGEEQKVLNLRTRQYVFREIIKESLYAGIEYDGGTALRWFPQPRSKAVVLDPQVQFGHPALAGSGVPTASLYATYLAEGKKAANVARMFEVPVREVTAAVRFEEHLRQAA